MQTAAELLDVLRRLHLLEAAELDHLARQLAGQKVDPKQLAKQLVQKGRLTHFQANQIFKGKGDQLLLGSYVLMDLVGEGGMGAVYKARNWKLGHVVAVKLIRRERLNNTGAVRRFEREIRTSAQLDHPNIVRTIDADEVKGTHLLVMEYVAGAHDLSKVVRERGSLPIEEACRYALQAALGLQHAFERGLVHRDIKPHNLLVSSGAVSGVLAKGGVATAQQAAIVKILDFGLARFGEAGEETSTLTQEGSVMGTMDYVAPEQARDAHQADIRADLYSLGCTMHYLLAGQAPFGGGTAAEKMYKHQFEEPPALEHLRPEVPVVLASVVRKLLAKDPQDRYQTPAALAADLEAILEGRSVEVSVPASRPMQAVPPPPPAEASQDTENPFAALSETAADVAPVSLRMRAAPAPVKQKSGLILALAGAGMTVVLATVLYFVFRSPARPPEPEEPRIALPKAPKRPSALELAAGVADDKRLQEEFATEEKKKAEEEATEKLRRADQERLWQKWPPKERGVRTKRIRDAEEPFKLLEARAQDKKTSFAALARDVAAFHVKHAGTPSAVRAAGLLSAFRSPLDELDAAKLSAEVKAPWQALAQAAGGAAPAGPPKELVAGRGEQRGRQWGQVSHVSFAGSQGKVILSQSGNTVMLMAADSRQPLAIIPQADLWALTGDGKLLAIGTFDGALRLFDVDAGRELWSFDAFAGGGIRSLCFSPDGKTIATGGGLSRSGNSNAGYFVRLWDVATGRPRGNSTTLDNQVVALVYAGDGNALAAASSSGQVALIDPRRPAEMVNLGNGPAQVAMLFSPDNKVLAAQWPANKGIVKIFDVATGKPVLSADDLVNNDGVARGAFSGDSSLFAAGESDGNVRIWRLPAGTLVRAGQAHKEGGVSSLAFSKDSSELWTASGWNSGDVRIWDKKGKPLKTMPGYDEGVRQVSELRMSPDGNVVAWLCGGKDIRLWRRDTQSLLATIHRPEGGPFAFSADGKRLVTGDFNVIRLWDAATGLETQPIRGRSPAQPSLAFSSDGRMLLAADHRGVIQRWSFTAASETDITQWQAPPGTFNPGFVPRLAFLADGQRFASFTEAGHLLRWNLAVESPISIAPNQYGCCVSPQARVALTSLQDGTITVWDLETTKELDTLPTKVTEPGDHRIVDLAVTPDERFALALQEYQRPRQLRLISLESKEEVFRFKEHDAARVAISPDGQHFVTTDHDGACSVWDLPAGTFLRKVEIGQPLAELPASFSPDGKTAAFIRGSDVVLFGMPSGNKAAEWHFPGPVHGLAFAPDGRHLAVAGGNGAIYILRLSEMSAPSQID